MEEAREPAEAFAFEFDQAGAVAAVKLADDWAKFVEVEEFGFALLYTYAEQHAQALPQITAAIEEVSHRFNDGGGLVYVGPGPRVGWACWTPRSVRPRTTPGRNR